MEGIKRRKWPYCDFMDVYWTCNKTRSTEAAFRCSRYGPFPIYVLKDLGRIEDRGVQGLHTLCISHAFITVLKQKQVAYWTNGSTLFTFWRMALQNVQCPMRPERRPWGLSLRAFSWTWRTYTFIHSLNLRSYSLYRPAPPPPPPKCLMQSTFSLYFLRLQTAMMSAALYDLVIYHSKQNNISIHPYFMHALDVPFDSTKSNRLWS